MSMHIEGPWLSTTSTKKRDQKITKAKQAELEAGWRERNVRLKEIGLPKETFEQYLDWVYGRGKKTKSQGSKNGSSSTVVSTTSRKKGDTQANVSNQSSTEANTKGKAVSLGQWITGPVASKPSPVYTGTKVIGIGTMHKSNAVPIFSDEEAQDISKMRRG